MDVVEAIGARRSIRRFTDKTVPRVLVERLLEAAIKAPSGKNLQPWSFVVLEGEKKNRVAGILAETVRQVKAAGGPTGSGEGSAKIIRQAPVTILIFDRLWNPQEDGEPGIETATGSRPWNLVDIQSIGAAIQNLLLAAQEAGLGTLWICDVFFAYHEISRFVGRANQALVAAVSLGYAGETPEPRPRQPWREMTEWLD